MLLSERLYSAAQIFLQYTMDTVICQGSLDISLMEWSTEEWNQADIRWLSRACRDTLSQARPGLYPSFAAA